MKRLNASAFISVLIAAAVLVACGGDGKPADSAFEFPRNITASPDCLKRPGSRLCSTASALADLFVDTKLTTPDVYRVPGTLSLIDARTARFEVDNFLSKSGDVNAVLRRLDLGFDQWQPLPAESPTQRHWSTADCDQADAVTCEVFWDVRPGPHTTGRADEHDVYTDVVFTVRLK